MPFIVDFPIENGGSFHSFLYVYQRVPPPKSKLWSSRMMVLKRAKSMILRVDGLKGVAIPEENMELVMGKSWENAGKIWKTNYIWLVVNGG